MVIKTSIQLKALVRNRSKGDSRKAQVIIRNFIMERFLERVSLSSYRHNIVIKGGVLIAAAVGLDQRSTMDIDSTLKNIELSENRVREMVQEIIDIEIEDNIKFTIVTLETITDFLDYPGIRVTLESSLDNMRIPLRLDFSTGDVITPKEIEYDYPLMFEERSISLLAYNFETVLAEKIETVISRGTVNTRMRDFYDIYALENMGFVINEIDLIDAVKNTFKNRGTPALINEWNLIYKEISEDLGMQRLWYIYQKKFDYADAIGWDDVINSLENLLLKIENSKSLLLLNENEL